MSRRLVNMRQREPRLAGTGFATRRLPFGDNCISDFLRAFAIIDDPPIMRAISHALHWLSALCQKDQDLTAHIVDEVRTGQTEALAPERDKLPQANRVDWKFSSN